MGDWLDIGSGGGFPGIVAAIMAKNSEPDRRFTLVDSDQRKCAFLRTVTRELGLNVKVFAERVEEIEPLGATVISARALDDLNGLLFHVERHLAPNGTAIFPKGASWNKEHQDALSNWSYKLDVIKSQTNPDATILRIKELTRV
ncbi:Ribosomal RNA small subunit methyltransferase G [Sulfitobacter guttiformis KCTC 32187]|nr:Ribosomal RNA small subunit methyltransferase G [Sulfitobacter guttiformis KCTC 32187]